TILVMDRIINFNVDIEANIQGAVLTRFCDDMDQPLKGIRIGVPSAMSYFATNTSKSQRDNFSSMVDVAAVLGAEIRVKEVDPLDGLFTSMDSLTSPLVNSEIGSQEYENWKREGARYSRPIR